MDGTVLGGAFMLWGPALSLEEEGLRAEQSCVLCPGGLGGVGAPPRDGAAWPGAQARWKGLTPGGRGALEGGIEASLCVLQGACDWKS